MLQPQRLFEKYWANKIRYYTSKVHLRGLGFVCVAAISNRPVSNNLDFPNIISEA
ncbi:hypothetical protein H6G74_03220 [Nostoc spongiaeforme FACHB-130]|uniref:Uncharacterized protein n=1 Tax=Nostoc spongiaeforme FACHB-130 TaxID=1357510 RepID=A0ABR8FSX5_9NOSO|nr:hypothetical protein [Nostoc spongiaeforme]MBD2593338.1 hypothetical protein [Nostoc spongiaeforme FACHB-130]